MIRVVLFALSVGAAGCMVGTEGAPRVLFGSGSLDGGAACPAGGRVVTAGVDSNGNDVLEASEISSSFPLCTGPHLQSGREEVDWRAANWNLAQGSGDRIYPRPVSFPVEFATVPSVVVSLSRVDSSSPQRVEVRASDINTKGFVLNIRTWESSVVNGVMASWLAYVE